MADVIRFWHRGDLVAVRAAPATTTLLEWLRADRVSMGTKEGCNQGDCGACTVVVGQPVASADGRTRLDLRPVLACSVLLPMLHGTALFTVEDLLVDGTLHPVQQAMVEGHGTQCGFCTPGIVMSLWCLMERAASAGHQVSADQVRAGLSGNVCRCTGYRSIVEAGVAAGADPVPRLDQGPILGALATILSDDALDYQSNGTTFAAPVTEDALSTLLVDRPGAALIAGGTDVVPAVPGRLDLPTALVWTGRVAGMSGIVETESGLWIGGAASLEDAWAALAERWPGLRTVWMRFASPPVRRAGTMAGNLATGSPVGDSLPVLLVLDSSVVLRQGDRERVVGIDGLHTGYRSTVLEAGEYISRIVVPRESLALDVRAYKVARRFDSDIATLSACFALRLDGDRIDVARAAFGGMSGVVHRATGVERALAGRVWDESTLRGAQTALAGDYAPITDHRGSAAYRTMAARGLLERWWRQTRPSASQSGLSTDVWSAP